MDWTDILPIALSVVSMLLSGYSIFRTNVLSRYPEQEPLYSDIMILLKQNMNYNSTIDKIFGIDSYTGSTKKLSPNEITCKVRRYFGRKEYKLLCDILELCNRANIADSTMYTLFSTIESGDPDKYQEICNAIIAENDDELTEQEYNKAAAYLNKIKIYIKEEYDGVEWVKYDYREIEKTISMLSKQIDEKVKVLKKSLEKKLMRR